MMNKIDQILADLYQSEPALRQHDVVLKKVVAELMALKPDTRFDENFRIELRRRLVQMAETQPQKNSLLNIFMKRFQLVGATVAVVALVAVSAWYLTGINSPSRKVSSMLSAPKITKAGENAFGSLINLQDVNGRGQGGGGNGAADLVGNPLPSTMSEAGSGGGGDSKMVNPDMIVQPQTTFRYVYKGDELTLAMDKVDVLKRIKNENNSNLSDFINRITFGLVNLNSFTNSKLQNFTFAEDKEFGYYVNVMLNEGSINISENWEKWIASYPQCGASESSARAELCPPQAQHDISKIPADEDLIAGANAFLDSHEIPRSNYGEPFVNQDWRVYYDSLQDKSTYWVPDTLTVVYPLQINGQDVFDESGNRNGLNVSVRYLPEIRVSGVYELTTQNYQSSEYKAETDVDRIMGLVEKGGFRNYYYIAENPPRGSKVVDLELGTPEVSYVKLWNYVNNANEELLVPALVFPVTNKPTNLGEYGWYQKKVVIPLVKEILDNENNNGGVTPIKEPAMPIDLDAPTATMPAATTEDQTQ